MLVDGQRCGREEIWTEEEIVRRMAMCMARSICLAFILELLTESQFECLVMQLVKC